MQISNNYQAQNFGNLKFAKNVTNAVKKAVYTNQGITNAAKSYNIKVSSFKNSSNLDMTAFDIAEKGKLFASKLKGHIETYTVHIKEIMSSDVTKAMEKAQTDKIEAKKLADEVKKLEKAFKRSLKK